MADILDQEQLVRHLQPSIDFAAERAWEHAQRVGWDKAYPMLTEDIPMPITREDLRETYWGLVLRMYAKLQDYLEDHDIHPADKAEILWVSYADFVGAVVLTPNRNPQFRFGMLWC